MFVLRHEFKENIGGYSGRAPPLTISNREVKTPSADGTASSTWESRSLPIQYLKGTIITIVPFFVLFFFIDMI